MLEEEFDHLLLSLHHLLQVDPGWSSWLVIIMGRLIRFWSVVVMTALSVGKGVIVIVDDSVYAIGVVFDFCSC
jgi:hypothetical protein